MNIRDQSQTIAWQVFLGCTTAGRLARELGITRGQAAERLRNATNAGIIQRVSLGVYGSRITTTANNGVCCGISNKERLT